MNGDLPERALRKLLAIAAGTGDDESHESAADFASSWQLPPRYRVLGELGRGGMGVVFEAHDHQLDRRCAIKRIAAVAGADDELRRRFAREALAAAKLRHPHIAAIYDATPDYISMQRIVGVPIDTIDRSERRLIVELLRDAAGALHHAHEQGIVHRDVKPSNLLVEGRHVFVLDFGLAKQTSLDAAQSIAGSVLGTPAFMSPEQALGRHTAVDARSDVYSLGATLHHCLTGAPPFAADDLPELLRRVVHEEPRAPRIERDLDAILLQCLAKDPTARYASARELADDLDRWLRHEPVRARHPSLSYRLRKHLERRGALLRAALLAAVLAALVTAVVLVPIAMRESAGRRAADEAIALSEYSSAVMQDAIVFERLGDLASAQAALDGGIDKVREFLPRHDVPRVRHLLSRLLRARGQPQLALEELEAALRGDPSMHEARFERGMLRAADRSLDAEQRAAAIADLSATITADSVLTEVDVLFGRAERERLCGNLATAKAMCEEVLAYEPSHIGARMALTHIALALGDDVLAQHYSVSAVDLQQGYGPVYFAREQRRLPTTIHGLDAALVDFGLELADSPDNALALAHRGIVKLRRAVRLHAEGSRDEALAALDSAIEDHDVTLTIHRDLPGALSNRAVCFMRRQSWLAAAGRSADAAAARARAIDDLARATELAPRLAEAHFNKGILAEYDGAVQRALGRAEAADRQYELAMHALTTARSIAAASWPHRPACLARIAAVAAAQTRD